MQESSNNFLVQFFTPTNAQGGFLNDTESIQIAVCFCNPSWMLVTQTRD